MNFRWFYTTQESVIQLNHVLSGFSDSKRSLFHSVIELYAERIKHEVSHAEIELKFRQLVFINVGPIPIEIVPFNPILWNSKPFDFQEHLLKFIKGMFE